MTAMDMNRLAYIASGIAFAAIGAAVLTVVYVLGAALFSADSIAERVRRWRGGTQ